jgi:uncharacterized membrane protein YphA (DoxX/SURF4 family)
MSTATRIESAYTPDVHTVTDVAESPHWSPATRAAFRVCFIYFGLYVLLTQMLSGMIIVPGWNFPELGTKTPFRQVIVWFGQHLLGIAKPYDPSPSGSGDRMYDWVHAYTLLTIALLGAAVWSYFARNKTHHDRLYRWFRVFLRIALGTTMLSYGFAKAAPLQMPNQLMRLVEPYGNISMMGVLWASIGSSTAYETFTGLAEIGAGALLLIPMTARAGAFVALMDVIAVFTLNMTYDVPVKLFSFHLVLMSLFLIAPVAKTMWELFILNRPARIPPEPPLGATPRVWRRAAIAQVVFAVYVLGMNSWGDYKAWYQYGGGSPRSALYGIWELRTMTVDGVDHPALLTDTTRFRRLIFDSPQLLIMQRMNDGFRYLRANVDTTARKLTLTTSPDTSKPKSVFAYQRPDRAHLILDGTMTGRAMHLELLYRNPNTFVQRSHGFNWVQEFPYNR